MLLVLLPQHLVSAQLPHAPTGFEIEEVKDKGNRRSFAVGWSNYKLQASMVSMRKTGMNIKLQTKKYINISLFTDFYWTALLPLNFDDSTASLLKNRYWNIERNTKQ